MSSPTPHNHTIADRIDLDTAYAIATQASSNPPQITVPEEERRQNPFLLSRKAEEELEERKRISKEEGRGGVVSPLEVEEMREKYVKVLEYMEKLQGGWEEAGGGERGGGGRGRLTKSWWRKWTSVRDRAEAGVELPWGVMEPRWEFKLFRVVEVVSA